MMVLSLCRLSRHTVTLLILLFREINLRVGSFQDSKFIQIEKLSMILLIIALETSQMEKWKLQLHGTKKCLTSIDSGLL